MFKSVKISRMGLKIGLPVAAVALAFALLSVMHVVAQSDQSGRIQGFELESPMSTVAVEEGTTLDDLGLPETLRAVLELDDTQREEGAFAQQRPEAGEIPDGADGSGGCSYEAPEDTDALYEAGELVVYTVAAEDGSDGESHRVYGSLDGEDAAWFSCDENGEITGAVADVPVTWDGDYDPDAEGTYILQAGFTGYTYGSARPYAVVTVGDLEASSASASDGGSAEATAGGAATYRAPNTVNTVSTREVGVEISLYDYDSSTINHGMSATSGYLTFVGSGTNNQSSSNPTGSYWYNAWSNESDSGTSQGIVQSMLSGGYPVLDDDIQLMIDSGPTTSLATLFGGAPDSAVTAFEDLDHLFVYDATTESYSFDSDVNFATINPNGSSNPSDYDGTFTVYSEPNTNDTDGNGRTDVHFVPFDEYGVNSGAANYHFGMKISTDFLMPSGGQINNYPMEFSFTGDDDVWVFVDDVLVMDIGGIHGPVGGTIDFARGTVTYTNVFSVKGSTTASGTGRDVSNYIGDLLYAAYSDNASYVEENLSYDEDTGHWYLKDYSSHSFDFFYMERGAGGANCSISFNLYTLQKNTLAVEKQVVSSDGSDQSSWLGDLDHTMRIVGIDGEGQALNLAGSEYTVYESGTDTELYTDTVQSGNLFTLKGGQYAVFAEITDESDTDVSYQIQELVDSEYCDQFGRFVVNGTEVTVDTSNPVEIDGRTYYVVSSSSLSGGSGNVVNVQNVVDVEALSTLVLEKAASRGSTFTEDDTFEVYLEVSGEPVDGSYGGLTFTSGRANLKVGDRFELPILAGADFALYEVDGDRHYVVYSATQSFAVLDGSGNPTGDYVTGSYRLSETTQSGTTMQTGVVGDIAGTSFAQGTDTPTSAAGSITTVTLTNSTYKLGIDLALEKTLAGWQSGQGEFTFDFEVAEVVQSAGDGSWVEQQPSDFSFIVPSISFSAGSSGTDTQSDSLYIMIDGAVQNGTHYLKVQELDPHHGSIAYDDRYYIITIQVAGEGDAQTASVADVSRYGSDGQPSDFTWEGADEGALSFLNTMRAEALKKDDVGNTLQGAAFHLYYLDGGTSRYHQYASDGTVTWTESQADATVFTSGADGSFAIDGLRLDTTYYLEETSAPEGFQLIDRKVVIYWDDNGQLVATYEGFKDSLLGNGVVTLVDYIDGAISGLRWLDADRDGIQDADEMTVTDDELLGMTAYLMYLDENGDYQEVLDQSRSRVSIETFLSGAGTSSTFTVDAGALGISDNGQVFTVTASASAGGSYSFGGLPSGTYAVLFASGDVAMGQFDVSPRDAGSDDTLDSDAQGVYTTVDGGTHEENEIGQPGDDTSYWLTHAVVRGIELKPDETLWNDDEQIYRSPHNDAGLYVRPGSITLNKVDSNDDPVSGIQFKLEVWRTDDSQDGQAGENWVELQTSSTGADGSLVFSDLEPGSYRITEMSSSEGSSLLAEPIEVQIPVAGNLDQSDDEPSYVYGDSGYWLEVGFKVVNGEALRLPMAGEGRDFPFPLLAVLLVAVGAAVATALKVLKRKKRLKSLWGSIR